MDVVRIIAACSVNKQLVVKQPTGKIDDLVLFSYMKKCTAKCSSDKPTCMSECLSSCVKKESKYLVSSEFVQAVVLSHVDD